MNNVRCAVRIALALSCVVPSVARPQTTTPEAAAEAYVTAMKDGNWMGMAGLMHAEALAELREIFTPMFALPESQDVLPDLLGVETLTEAEALTDTELFAAFMRFIVTQDPDVADALRTSTVQVLGHVLEGDRDAHVVFRTSMKVSGIDMTQMDVITLRRAGMTWRGLLKGDLSAVAMAIRQALAQPEIP